MLEDAGSVDCSTSAGFNVLRIVGALDVLILFDPRLFVSDSTSLVGFFRFLPLSDELGCSMAASGIAPMSELSGLGITFGSTALCTTMAAEGWFTLAFPLGRGLGRGFGGETLLVSVIVEVCSGVFAAFAGAFLDFFVAEVDIASGTGVPSTAPVLLMEGWDFSLAFPLPLILD